MSTVRAVVNNVGLQGYAPHSGFGAKPSLEDGFLRHNYFFCSSAVDVDFFIVADCDIACLEKIISAQEGLVSEGGDHVHRLCWLPHGMVEFCLCGARGFVAVCYSENFSGRPAVLDERTTHHSGVGGAYRVVGG